MSLGPQKPPKNLTHLVDLLGHLFPNILDETILHTKISPALKIKVRFETKKQKNYSRPGLGLLTKFRKSDLFLDTGCAHIWV